MNKPTNEEVERCIKCEFCWRVMDEAGVCQPCESGFTGHASDCSQHNAPAYPIGACDCSLKTSEGGLGYKIINYIVSANLLQVVEGIVVWSEGAPDQLSSLLIPPTRFCDYNFADALSYTLNTTLTTKLTIATDALEVYSNDHNWTVANDEDVNDNFFLGDQEGFEVATLALQQIKDLS